MSAEPATTGPAAADPATVESMTPPPDYPLGRAGETFVHAGPRLHPRIVSVPTAVAVHDVDLLPGAELFTEFGRILSELDVRGAGVEVVSGGFSALPYVRPAYGPDAAHPMHFSAEMSAECPVRVRAGSATLGFRSPASDLRAPAPAAPAPALAPAPPGPAPGPAAPGPAALDPFGHIHASWTDRLGRHRGGHLLPGATIGAEGLRLRVFAYSDVELLSAIDEETGLPTFAPRSRPDHRVAPNPIHDVEVSPTSASSAHQTDQDTVRTGVVSRIRPGQMIDEAVLDVCRAAGFTRAEVRGSLGSTVGAIFEDVNGRGERAEEVVVDWPAAEYTVLRGTVEDSPGEPHVELVAEAVDVHGRVLAGRVRTGANPVAVTFELLLLELP
ncbi:hypothetical protein DFO66_105162 [Brevibacterium sanguinis]|uniref:DNA-binding protein with PD1-like motif n=2 Tax=Brevibacterium TaxID=1696 RepID=A0A366IJK0_9MICO|nr:MULTISPECIES: hypothetical protein [Brevibacterium]RBP65056.1 hypothetical protein DFO66_105162 [Brevibacterium sanguinis]RBP71319.1 hypothetical protein DFO65_106162 [Brevibacterium celere]